jgi:hypothetical protein
MLALAQITPSTSAAVLPARSSACLARGHGDLGHHGDLGVRARGKARAHALGVQHALFFHHVAALDAGGFFDEFDAGHRDRGARAGGDLGGVGVFSCSA